jgi:hypothetical protein
MRLTIGALAIALVAATDTLAARTPQSLNELLARATAYVSTYESAFSLLVSEETYVQEIQRPISSGGNLSRANPGGGIQGGGAVKRQVLRSDYLLVLLGPGGGWMPFRDVFEVNAAKVKDREDRLVKLFLSGDETRFDQADRIMAESTRHNIGNVARTINIPTLAMMFLHPKVRDRFRFEADGDETIDGRGVRRVSFKETARPTLMKTTRGADLAIYGHLWIEPETGVVVRTFMNASDPAVRANVKVTFRRDDTLAIWVPALMEEFYKAAQSLDEIHATATYANVRRFGVETDEKLKKPPGRSHEVPHEDSSWAFTTMFTGVATP